MSLTIIYNMKEYREGSNKEVDKMVESMMGSIVVLMIVEVVVLSISIYALYWFVKACRSVHEIEFLVKDIKELKKKEFEFKKEVAQHSHTRII